MSRKSTAMTLGFGIAAILLFAILLTAETWMLSPGSLNPVHRQVLAAFRDRATQWLILSALACYFILFCVLEHRLSPPVKWWRLGNANLWLFALVTLALLRYPLLNQNSYAFVELAILLSGIVFGKSVSTLVRWRSDRLSQNAAWLAGSLICFLAVAALWQPRRGMIYHYHDVVRWSGIWNNPNHYGELMGAGLLLAIGIGVRILRNNSRFEPLNRSAPVPGCSDITVANIMADPGTAGLAEVAAPGDGRTPQRFMGWSWRVTDGKRRKMLHVILCSAAAVVCGYCLFKSYSRGAWLGVLAGLVYLAVQAGKSSRPFVWLRRNRLALVSLIASLTLLTFWQFRFSEWPPAQRIFSVVNINDFSWRNRVASWEWAVRSMLDHPLAGFGWRFPVSIQPNIPPQQLNPAQAVVTNDFLVLGASAGVPALICFAVYFALSFRHKLAAPGAPLSVFTICRGSLFVFLVGFWLDGGLFFMAVTLVFWMLMELSRLEPAKVKTDDVQPELESEPVIIPVVSRSKGEIWLRRSSLILTAIAVLQTVVYVGTPFLTASHLTLAIARKCLLPAGERSDLDFLASNPIWQGQQLRALLEHVDLANYNRRLINWKLDDSMYREHVLTPAIQAEHDGPLQWRRPLWEYFYPIIRKQKDPEAAAKMIMPELRKLLKISDDVPLTIEEMWQRHTADAGGFEAVCVAAFRSVGIPARLGEDGRAEFFDGKIWRPVSTLAT